MRAQLGLAKVRLPVAVRAGGNGVLQSVFATVCELNFVMNLKVRAAVFGSPKWRRLAAYLAGAVRSEQHFRDHIWISNVDMSKYKPHCWALCCFADPCMSSCSAIED